MILVELTHSRVVLFFTPQEVIWMRHTSVVWLSPIQLAGSLVCLGNQTYSPIRNACIWTAGGSTHRRLLYCLPTTLMTPRAFHLSISGNRTVRSDAIVQRFRNVQFERNVYGGIGCWSLGTFCSWAGDNRTHELKIRVIVVIRCVPSPKKLIVRTWERKCWV